MTSENGEKFLHPRSEEDSNVKKSPSKHVTEQEDESVEEVSIDTPAAKTFGPLAFVVLFVLAALIALAAFFGIPAVKPFYSSWRAEQFIKQAEVMLAGDDYRSAYIMLRNAWRHLNNLDPESHLRKANSKKLFILLSESSRKAGESDYPLYLGMALEADPKDESLAVETVRALVESKRHDISPVLVPSITASFPNNAEIFHLLGIMMLQRGELDAGYNALKRASELDPNSESIKLSLGTIEALSREPAVAERGRETISRARQNPELYKVATVSLAEITSLTDTNKALELWDEVVARYPDDFDARIKRLNLIHRSKPQEVREQIDKLWSQFTSISDRLQLVAQSFGWLGVDIAQQLLERLPNADRIKPSARLLQIALDAARQQWQKVIETARLITEDQEAPVHQKVVGWLWMARANKEMGNDDVAASSIRNASQQASNIPQLLLISGQQLEFWNMNSEAQIFYKQAANSTGPVQLLALNSLAIHAQAKRNAADLLQIYEKLLQLLPSNPLLTNNVAALLLMRNEQLNRALDLAQQVYMANPANQRVPQIADTYALALALNNRVAEALEIYSKIPVNALEIASIRLHYARVLAMAGRQDQSWEILKEINTADLFREEQEMLDNLRKDLL